MALIKCPDCGKEISDKASACIHCGCPVQQEVHIMPTQPSKIVATEVSTQSRTKSKQIIAAVLSLSSLMLTVHAIFFQNQEILSMTRFLSGGVLAFYSMLIYLLSAFGYVFLQKHIKAGAILTTSYTLAILLCQVFLIFRNSFSLPLCLLTIIVVLAYAVIYWLAATGTFKNANPLMYVVIGYLACICFEMFFSTRYGTSFSSAFLFVQLPTVLYYVSTVLFAVTGVEAAYAKKKENLSSGQYQSRTTNVQDASSTGYAILCFCFPIVGLILYCVWRESLPKRAKSAGMGGLIGFSIGVALTVLFYVWLMS